MPPQTFTVELTQDEVDLLWQAAFTVAAISDGFFAQDSRFCAPPPDLETLYQARLKLAGLASPRLGRTSWYVQYQPWADHRPTAAEMGEE